MAKIKQNRRNLVCLISICLGLMVVNFPSQRRFSVLNAASSAMTVSKIGLSTSTADGVANFTKLCSALENGQKIIVDDFYPITVTAPYTLTKDIKLYGLNNNCGFNFNVSSDYVFEVAGEMNIDLQKLKFTGKSNIIFNNEAMTNYIKTINVSGCVFEGSIVLFSLNIADADYDRFHGIGEMTFKENKLNNITPINKKAIDGFIYLQNLPFKKIELADNTVCNFVNCILYNGTTNTYQDPVRLVDNRLLITAHDNKVINDPDWFSDYPSAIYHAFILAECSTLKYYNNHVEGLKGLRQATYDVYASCRRVYYKNNYWKNNVQLSEYSWDEPMNHSTLMKSKENPSPKGIVGFRVYKNNKFILEESYVTSLGYDKKWAVVGLIESVSGNLLDFEITGNYIEAPVLTLQKPTHTAARFVFNNNTIKAKGISGWFLNQGTGIDAPNVEICGNRLECEASITDLREYQYNDKTPFEQLRLFNMYTPGTLLDKVKINNNYINADLYKNFINGAQVNCLEMLNNRIINLNKNTIPCEELLRFTSVNQRVNIDSLQLTAPTFTDFNLIKIKPVNGRIRAKIAASSYSSLFKIMINDYVRGESLKKYSIAIEVAVSVAERQYKGIYNLRVENGKLSYGKAKGKITVTTLAANSPPRLINPDGGDLPAALKVRQLSGIYEISLDSLEPISNPIVDIAITMKEI